MEGTHLFSGQGATGPGNEPFLLAVITLPLFFPGEAECLEGLLAAGLEKLHLRKPGAGEEEIEGLLKQIAPRWRSRLVLHGGGKLWGLAVRYGIPQVHCPLNELATGMEFAISTSLHSWEEMKEIEGAGLGYVLMSPLFDSISKAGYPANPLLLQRPAGPYPCKVIGLGGIDKDTIGGLVRGGWDGAAVLGWIWEEPGAAVERYKQLKNSISLHCL
jgi:thiamine monophosphate synthase